MNIELRRIGELRPYSHNARVHSRKQIRQIANSIERFGFCNPALIDDEGQIIAGHGRVEAAKLLQIEKIPMVRLSHLSPDEKRVYPFADNPLAEKRITAQRQAKEVYRSRATASRKNKGRKNQAG